MMKNGLIEAWAGWAQVRFLMKSKVMLINYHGNAKNATLEPISPNNVDAGVKTLVKAYL